MLVFKGLFKKKVQEGFAGEIFTVSTFAGSTAGYADGVGTDARFNSPVGIAIDSSGNLYIVDSSNHRIRKIDTNGKVTTFAGSTKYLWGSTVTGSADGVGTAAMFTRPYGITIDSSNNLYVVDSGNSKIRKIDATGNVTTIAGSGNNGFANGVGADAQFKIPIGITIDSSNNLYIADADNHKIRKITSNGTVTTFAGSTIGYADGVGAAAQFNSPLGITIDSSNNLYITDAGNRRIRKITPDGTVSTIAGSGTSGSADGVGTAAQFNISYGITIDSSGNLYIADTFNHKIRKIDTTGTVTTIAGYGSGFADGVGTAASFFFPMGIRIDSSNNLYIADAGNHKIRKIELTCPAGSKVSNGICVLCAAGSYSAAGAPSCSSCAAGSYSAAGASTCSSCAAGFFSLAGATSCSSCSPNPIYGEKTMVQSTTKCDPSACLAGYELSSTTGKCVKCGSGTYSADGSTCITCSLSSNATTMASSTTSCTVSACKPGYYLSEGKCVQSPAGSFSAGGSATSSTPCEAGTFSAVAASSCTPCEAGTYSAVGALSCTSCEAGTFSSVAASSCTPCKAGTYSADRASTCVSCQPNSTYGEKTMAVSPTKCDASVCLAGYKLSSTTGKCIKCEAGSSSGEGSSTCTTCAAGSYSAAGSSTCSSCAAGSYSEAGASSCTTCSTGTYSDKAGSLACANCSISPGAATMVSSTTSCTASSCLPGYKLLSNGSCEKCGAGFYGADGISCTSCGPGLSSEPGSAGISACKCPPNSYGTNSSCTKCPTNSASPIGSTTISACSCIANFYGTNGSCTECPSSSVSKPGSTKVSDCVCPPGKILVSIGDTNQCITVDQVNKYSMKAYNPSGRSTYNNGPDTSLIFTINTDLCPPNSTDPCCKQNSATNTDCIDKKFWKPTQVFDKNVAGFEDYGRNSELGAWI